MKRKEKKISRGEISSVWFNNLNLVLPHAQQPTTITCHCMPQLKTKETFSDTQTSHSQKQSERIFPQVGYNGHKRCLLENVSSD